MKIGKYIINARKEPEQPEIGMIYHHKDRDPHDMVSYVVPTRVDEFDLVEYRKVYKQEFGVPDTMDSATLVEFNQWFRKGA